MLPKFAHADGSEAKPTMPYGWSVQVSKDQAATVSWVDEGGGGKKGLHVSVPKGQTLRLCQGYVEVAPGGTYDVGLSAKGSGRIELWVWVSEPAPAETWAANMDAGAEWKDIHLQKKVGPHRHLASLCVVANGPAEVTFRQAEFNVQAAASSPAIYRPDKLTKDADTIFFEDFDGPGNSITTSTASRLTDKDGGRFGRGLVTSSKDGGTATHLSIGELPAKGTIEFWFKPDKLPVADKWVTFNVPLAVTTQTPGMEQTQLEFEVINWCATAAFGFRRGYDYDRAQSFNGTGAGGAGGRWEPGTTSRARGTATWCGYTWTASWRASVTARTNCSLAARRRTWCSRPTG